MLSSRWLVLVGVAGVSSACMGPLQQGACEYEHGRYPQALEALHDAERHVVGWSVRDRARYALYRGLVHLALGDCRASLRWLAIARRAQDADAMLLSDDERNHLASAWAHLGP